MAEHDHRRLIEDYLPIEAISKEASRKKSVRKGHISTLHLWWARRPLVARRAAVYGALVPASQFVPGNHADLPAQRPAKFWVYVVKCNHSSFYIAQTDDRDRGYEEHDKGQVDWTAPPRYARLARKGFA